MKIRFRLLCWKKSSRCLRFLVEWLEHELRYLQIQEKVWNRIRYLKGERTALLKRRAEQPAMMNLILIGMRREELLLQKIRITAVKRIGSLFSLFSEDELLWDFESALPVAGNFCDIRSFWIQITYSGLVLKIHESQKQLELPIVYWDSNRRGRKARILRDSINRRIDRAQISTATSSFKFTSVISWISNFFKKNKKFRWQRQFQGTDPRISFAKLYELNTKSVLILNESIQNVRKAREFTSKLVWPLSSIYWVDRFASFRF